MSDESKPTESSIRILSPQAQRALAEADERRKRAAEQQQAQTAEINGRGGLDPVRSGDWEIKGIACDF